MTVMEWIDVNQELPPLDLPVWLYLPDPGTPAIGCRSDTGEGWCWALCDGYDYWYNGKEWAVSGAEEDDLQVTHWMRLPEPPT